jgi:uncharacterized protein YndB with AHSA1/START domain
VDHVSGGTTRGEIVIDLAQHLQAVHREVSHAGADNEMVAVVMRRTYQADIDDVWNAVTDPDRVRRWFLPLTGDLRVGGSFQLEGNAGGDILDCARPDRLRVTFGGPDSVVELRLAAVEDGTTTLELDHRVPLAMAGSVAGSIFVGPGWDGAFLGLSLYLAGEVPVDPVAAANSPEAQEYSRQSVASWVDVSTRSGLASADEIAGAKAMALSQYAPDLIDQP